VLVLQRVSPLEDMAAQLCATRAPEKRVSLESRTMTAKIIIFPNSPEPFVKLVRRFHAIGYKARQRGKYIELVNHSMLIARLRESMEQIVNADAQNK
jgi:hypothetical protein